MTTLGGKNYGEGVTSGRLLWAPAQWELANPAVQADFVRVRTKAGSHMYVRDTPEAIATAREIYGIMSEVEFQGRQDPAYKFFAYDVNDMQEQIDKQFVPYELRDDEIYYKLLIRADGDEDPDWLYAICATALRNLGIDGDPALEYEFGNQWSLYIVVK